MIKTNAAVFWVGRYGEGPHDATKHPTGAWFVTPEGSDTFLFYPEEVIRVPAHRGEYDPNHLYEDDAAETAYYNHTAPHIAKHREDDTYFKNRE